MKTQAVYSQQVSIQYGDINRFGELTLPKIFDYFQDIAFIHADHLAYAVEKKKEFDYAAVWTKMKGHMDIIPKWKDVITISTWISPVETGQHLVYRNFAIENSAGKEIGNGYGAFVFFDLKTRKAIPIPDEMVAYPTHDRYKDQHPFAVLPALSDEASNPTEIACCPEISAVWSDIDLYQHVNNVRYISWAMDNLPHEFLKTHQCQDVEIQFKKEMRLRDRAEIYTQNSENEFGHLRIRHEIKLLSHDNQSGHTLAKLQTVWRKRSQ
jgi:acyl-ACP thioesterase